MRNFCFFYFLFFIISKSYGQRCNHSGGEEVLDDKGNIKHKEYTNRNWGFPFLDNKCIYAIYENLQDRSLGFINSKSLLHVSEQYKGIKISQDGTVTNKRDGFSTLYELRKSPDLRSGAAYENRTFACSQSFFIYGHFIDIAWKNCTGSEKGTQWSTCNNDCGDKINLYDLPAMIDVFLDDLINNNNMRAWKDKKDTRDFYPSSYHNGNPISRIDYFRGGLWGNEYDNISPDILSQWKSFTLDIIPLFGKIGDKTIAESYGIYDDEKIILKIDPEKWAEASTAKRWYILYHELGHDVLNFEHGVGGKMMFNISKKDYTWNEFIEDRDYMFKTYLETIKKID